MTEVEIDGKKYRRTVKTFGEVLEGDLLESPDVLVPVEKVFETEVPSTMFDVEVEGGEVVRASGDHLFYTVSNLDTAGHRQRCKRGRRWVKRLRKSTVKSLEEWAEEPVGSEEVMLSQFSEAVINEGDTDGEWIIARIAESIGPVSEVNFFVDELGGMSSIHPSGSIQAYDRSLMAQQLLSFLRGSPWKTIVGKVITVEDMVSSGLDYYIPRTS